MVAGGETTLISTRITNKKAHVENLETTACCHASPQVTT